VAPDRGIVGDRHLVAIQTFDISRLTTHAVAIVPGTFVAVSGIGPKGDSNGSGKTTFLAALSILLADPQWNLESSGGRHASGILFRPDAAGLDPSLRATPAPYGYVVGVFAEPDAVRESALTVWVRVSATSPHVQAKCAPWLHVADAPTEEDRALQADRLWQELPHAGVISAKRMAQELYGDAPRCLSYLDTSLRPAIPSLLSQEMTKMRPAEIGTALIALAGRTGQLEEENHSRGTTLELQAKLKDQESQEDLTLMREDAELAGVSARDRARTLLADAQQKWTRYAAWQYLAVLRDHDAVEEEISGRTEVLADRELVVQEAETALATLRSTGDLAERERNARESNNSASRVLQSLRDEHAGVAAEQAHLIKERNELQPVAARWKGTALKQAQIEHERTQSAQATARIAVQAATDAVRDATISLDNARAGRSGEAGRLAGRLRTEAAVAEAAPLADLIDLDDKARPTWEPRLWALRDAVVVPHTSAGRARAALADAPGAQIIAAEFLDPAAPRVTEDGIHYPAGLAPLIRALRQRLAVRQDPLRADDDALAVSVLGGFPEPLVGREALIRQAERDLEEAEASLESTCAALSTADARLTLAKGEHDAAQAAERLIVLTSALAGLDEALGTLNASISTAEGTLEAASEALIQASVRLSSHNNEVEAAERRLGSARDQETDARRQLGQACTRRTRLPVEAWASAFTGSRAEAERLWVEGSDGHAPSAQTLLRESAEQLREALAVFLVNRADPPEDLVAAEKARGRFADQEQGNPEPFEAVAAALRNRLDGAADHDRVTQSRIIADREKREMALGELRIEVADAAGRLSSLQDMIENSIEATMREVSKALDRMTAFGAELQVNSVRPDGAAPWIWEVTPRWRRSPNGGLVPYQESANGAQVKVFAIQLVLAALTADAQTTGRVLILDELGNSLGDVNRRDVLRNLRDVAEQQQVTILGTCQDSVLSDAADFFGELIWFTHASATDALNQPTRVWGHDGEGTRVELTADWLRAGRANA
jgi:hypothetical protein